MNWALWQKGLRGRAVRSALGLFGGVFAHWARSVPELQHAVDGGDHRIMRRKSATEAFRAPLASN